MVEYQEVSLENLRSEAHRLYRQQGARLVTMIGTDEREKDGYFRLYYVFSLPAEQRHLALVARANPEQPEFPALTPVLPAAHWYEREVQDLLGLTSLEHPDPRPLVLHEMWPEGVYPLRKDYNGWRPSHHHPGRQHPFPRIDEPGVFEVPVGPIHAGIIEPGHFRFSVNGEYIHHLEPRLFYTHRGLEKLAEGKTVEWGLALAERICAVCAFSHSVAYSQAVEKMSGTDVPLRAQFIRTILVELERLYNHIGDLSNLCAGTGLAFGVSQLARLKERLLQLNEALTGNRYLRDFNAIGGVKQDWDQATINLIVQTVTEVFEEYEKIIAIIDNHDFHLERLANTGILSTVVAQNLGAVGVAARAAGVDRDVRRDHPHLAYSSLPLEVPVLSKGDVEARYRIRQAEIEISVSLIQSALDQLPAGPVRTALAPLPAWGQGLGYAESARGDDYHWLMLDDRGLIYRYRIRSASYCNWPAVAQAVPGNMIPDFPLINKSFELCYSCCDR
ncbi:MAG: NADH-quinone oxidoreductase subunit C [Bacillota bacterium]